MTGLVHRLISAVFAVILLAACAATPPDTNLTFKDMQAQQLAVQAILVTGQPGAPRPWQGPDGASGTAALVGAPDNKGCRKVKTTGPGGTITDFWCPTPHGFWVHPDELFYRNATGRETYGGAVRSRHGTDGMKAQTEPADTRPDQIDCLRLLREEQRLADDGREGAARAKRRAFHSCLQQSR